MSRIIVGVDAREGSEDAVAFASELARKSGAEVTVANAYPWRHLGFVGTQAYDEFLLEESENTLRRMTEPLRDLPGLETRSLSEPSPARALQELALELEADLIVIGSSHAGRLGRVLPGSTAERLLHGSARPVAVVPTGFRTARPNGSGIIACGWDGSPESDAALAAAEKLARDTSAALLVIRTFEPTSYQYPPALGVDCAPLVQAKRRDAEQGLAERVAELSPEIEVRGRLHDGLAARELIGVSNEVDLMVLGSRGYGPLHAVLLGGVSGEVIHAAGCPVIIIPNAAHGPVASLLGASAHEPARA